MEDQATAFDELVKEGEADDGKCFPDLKLWVRWGEDFSHVIRPQAVEEWDEAAAVKWGFRRWVKLIDLTYWVINQSYNS